MILELILLAGLATAQIDYSYGGTNYCINKAFFARLCIHEVNPNSSCCTVVTSEFNDAGCFCNKISVALLGTTWQGPPTQAEIANIFTKCGKVPKDCSTYGKKTYNGGTCAYKDEELDFMRFAQGKKFSDTLLSFADQITCFDYTGFKNTVSTIFTPTATAYAGQGLGIYTGIDHISEYFSLLAPKVNKGFLMLTHSTEPTAVVAVQPKNITIGSYISNRFTNGSYSNSIKQFGTEYTDYLEMTFNFNGCDILASNAYVPANSDVIYDKRKTGVIALTEMLYRTVNADLMTPSNPNLQLLGITGICKQHTRYCTGANSQFASETDCINFYKSLPRYSATCGVAGIATGNSVTCRAKHQFMAAINPSVHCPHIGRNSAMCLDSLCQGQGNATAIDINKWPVDMSGNLTAFAASMATDFTNTGLWKYSQYCVTGGYTTIGAFSRLAASTGQVWALNSAGLIFKWNGAVWTQIPGALTQIAICPNEMVFGVNSNSKFYTYDPATNAWNLLPGLVSTIACGHDGFNPNGFYGVNTSGQVFSFTNATRTWTQIDGILSGSVGSLAVGGGKIWGLDNSGNIYSRSATSSNYTPWTTVAGNLKSIAAGAAGVVGVNGADYIYKFNGANWILNTGLLRTVAVNNIFLYGTSVGGVAYQRPISDMI